MNPSETQQAAAALAAAERMDAGLASTVMGKLQYREGYPDISKTAQATTISLLKAVCGQADWTRSTFLSVAALISQQLGDPSYRRSVVFLLDAAPSDQPAKQSNGGVSEGGELFPNP